MPSTIDNDLGVTTLTREVSADVWGTVEDIYFAVPSMYGIGVTWSQFAGALGAARIDGARFVDVRVRSRTRRGTVIDQVVSRIEIETMGRDETP